MTPSRAPTSSRWTIPRSTTDSIGSSGSITSASARADGVAVDGTAAVGVVGSAAVGAVAPARSRAMPIWVPASLTRSLRGPPVGPR